MVSALLGASCLEGDAGGHWEPVSSWHHSVLLGGCMEPEARELGLEWDLRQAAGHLPQVGLLKHLRNIWVSLKDLELAVPFPYTS